MKRGLFIALEGIDGSGTTTQARRLASRLHRMHSPVLSTREPSAGPIGRLIDRLISGKGDAAARTRRFHEAIALLFAADRLDHLEREVWPALRRGQIVISNRYVMSSWAYQSVKVDEQWVRQINRRAPMADLTILLDAPPQLCLERIGGRRARRQIFEHAEFLRRVRAYYRRHARAEQRKGHRLVILDARHAIAEVHELIWKHLSNSLSLHTCRNLRNPASAD